LQKKKEFTEYLVERGVSRDRLEAAVDAVEEAAAYFEAEGKELTEASVEDFKGYVQMLMDERRNTEDTLVALARYVYFLDMKKVWIYFAAILGGRNILPSIAERLEEIAGKEVKEKVFNEVKTPPLGSMPAAYCEATKSLMDALEKEMSPDVYRRVLAGNHHRVNPENFMDLKRQLEELGNIDAWLEKMHDEAVAELEQYLREDKVWYEQVITPEIVEHVRGNQELLAGVREGEWIYNTKFPYSPAEYLKEKDPLMKRYYMCHCPLAREAVLAGSPEIPVEWCYCSAGYGKLRYDVAFGTETEAEVLKSVFDGSDTCRFRIKIPADIMEKYV
jgi:hypothetical protein